VRNSRLRGLIFLGFSACAMAAWPTSAWADDVALCNQSEAKPDEGIAACTRLLERPGVDVDTVYFNRARGWSKKGVLDSAIEDYTTAIQRNPKNTDALLNRGVVWYRKSEFDRAITDFTQIINARRGHPTAYIYRGVVLTAKGEFDRAIADFDQAVRLDAKNPSAYRYRATTHHLKRDFNRAISDFDAASKLAPQDATIYNDRAQVWVDRGEFDRAIADYNQTIRLDPKNWRGYSSRGEAKRLKGDLNGALADHNAAIKLDPTAHDAYNNRALAFKDRGELDRAIADLNEAIFLKPTDARALGNRGEVKRLQNDLEGSRADLDNAIKTFPNSAVLFCRRGDTWLAIGGLERALDDFNQARIISPGALCANAGRGLVLEKLGDLAAARAEFEAAVKAAAEKDPDPVTGRQAQAIAAKRLADIAGVLTARKRDTDAEERQRTAEADKLRQQVEELQRQAAEERKRRGDAPKTADEPPIDPGFRVALVIGNSSYKHVGLLANPRRDAEAVAKALRDIGFQRVIVEHDLDRQKLLSTLGRFEAEVTKADWGVIYYAGHGMELSGVNYVIPVDAKLDTDRDVQDQAIPLDRVMASIEHAKKLRLVVLDACRDNPFLPRMRRIMVSATRDPLRPGLASIEPERGTLVAYAAKHGQVAADGSEGKHSPFVSAFLARLQEPRLEINMLFRHVRDDVMKATSYRQEPHVYGTLPAQTFFFKVK
jgi:tetratricopeptide (TPR) repeat protein